MKIFIITIRNKNDNHESLLVEKYEKLIKNFFEIEIININFRTQKINKNIYKKEYNKAISMMKPNSIMVALDEFGKLYGSQQFSEKIKHWEESCSNLYFFIGGPDGLSKDVLDRADLVISLSNLTFPHVLAKVILMEQIYRSKCIMNNHPYHRS
tara:strand:- start:145 stop:606 length:462 start_codon:yes stop_codon:yes gene_type:complete